MQLSLLKLPSRSLSYANRPAPLLPIQYYIYTREDKRPRSRPTLDSPWHKRARFGEAEQKSYLCISRKRKSAGFSSFRVFRGKLSYMSGKIILYDRKNYKQARENLLGDNFYEVLYRENFVFNRRLAAARHSPSDLGLCSRLAQTFPLSSPEISRSKFFFS